MYHLRSANKGSHKKVSRCGQCEGCSRTQDCSRCDFCKDMRKFGGANKLKQKCRLRQCQNFGSAAKSNRNSTATKYESDSDYEFEAALKKFKETPKKTVRKASTSSSKTRVQHSSRRALSPDEDDVEPPRQCLGPKCVQPARPNSKYCSEDCGLNLAERRLCELLPSRISEWQSSPCVAEELNKRALTSIRSEQMKCKVKLAELDSRQRKLETVIAASRHLKPLSDDEDENEGEWTIHCVTCGHEVNGKHAVKHMERCFVRTESHTSYSAGYKTRVEGNSICDYYNSHQKSYCKRLRVMCPEHFKEPKGTGEEVCGFPIPADRLSTDMNDSDVYARSGQFCRIRRLQCRKHVGWNRIRLAQIDMERVNLWTQLDELFEKERANLNAMSQRAGVISLMLHSTYDHDRNQPIKSLDQILKHNSTV